MLILQVFWDFEHSSKLLEIFANLERFNPSHFEGIGPPPHTYVPFGGGPRNMSWQWVCTYIDGCVLALFSDQLQMVNRSPQRENCSWSISRLWKRASTQSA